ncbi:hypothetical protein WA026_004804 [Henosepilachna vigintioctopunctata]|uniref:Cytochrome P450 n=1 Tax=Henosepilachna vigintioctopunctata TaxID=420089 RepID=A0AAW1ULC2_9CUCU
MVVTHTSYSCFREKWRQRRKLLQPAFHFSILKKFVEVFRSESKRLVHQLKEHENDELNIVPIISKFILSSTCETFMGTTLKSVDSQGKYYSSILKMGNICVRRATEPWMLFDILYSLTPMRWRQRKLLNYLHKFSSDIIARRKKEFQDFMKLEGSNFESYSERKRLAMLDILLSAQKESGIIDDEGIREEVDSFMFAGYDTTSLSLIHTIMLLANNRREQDKIYEEIISVFGAEDTDVTMSQLQELKFMEMCIKESLRIYPSAPLIARNPSEDVETKSGNIIPKDTSCIIPIYDIHRKEDTFPNPEVFDPYRFLPENIAKRHPFSYIPFSGGPRNCIGQRFALLELKCALLEILRNFILEPVDTPQTVEFVLDIVLRPAGPIRVKFKTRK